MMKISEVSNTVEGQLPLSEQEFIQISTLVRDRFGIDLSDKKRDLVKGRLNSLVKSLGFSSFGEYYDAIVEDSEVDNLLALIDRISTNHSYFFREQEHFQFLIRYTLPEICKALPDRKLRIWCAGCAAGWYWCRY